MKDWKFIAGKYSAKVLGRRWALGHVWDVRMVTTDHSEDFYGKVILRGRRKLMVDAGAAGGRWTIPASRFYDRIVAFEPSPSTVEILKRNLRLNHVGNVQIMRMALSDQAGRASFHVYKDRKYEQNTLLEDHSMIVGKYDSTIEVETARLDSYGVRPDLIKIDTEGAEVSVIRGAMETIAACHPDLCVEIHVRGAEHVIMGMLPEYKWTSHYRDTRRGLQTHLIGVHS